MSAILTIDQVRSFAVSETGEAIQLLFLAKQAGVEVAPTVCITRTALRQVLDENPKLMSFVSSTHDSSDLVKLRVAEEQLLHSFSKIKFSEKFVAEVTQIYQDYLGGSFVRIIPGSAENITGDANIFDSLKSLWAAQIAGKLESKHSQFFSSLTDPLIIQTQLQATASGSIYGTKIRARLGVKADKNDHEKDTDIYFFSKSGEESSSEIASKEVFFQRSSDKFIQKKTPKKSQKTRVIDKQTAKRLFEIYRTIQRKILKQIRITWEKDATQLIVTTVEEFEAQIPEKKHNKQKLTKVAIVLEDWPEEIHQDCTSMHEAIHLASDISHTKKDQKPSQHWLRVSTPALLIDLHEVLHAPFSGAIIDLVEIAHHLGDQGPDFSTTTKLCKTSLQKIPKDELKKAKPILLQLHHPNKHLLSTIYTDELLGATCAKADFEIVMNMLSELEQ
ncbi:MAG: hypothetical protein COY80_01170 [Candidatus Pacebacteria bacterium CG_4_10_14_0_8_um_filter_42_14]|nr:MAG: hypothetical protein COY80_01170 [Candidatus Pacebacteria bacterium CG_4_10_14_0_8_um_filter_42_14]